jgi:hypothetical protein
MYYNHYVLRLRERQLSSALFFGSAIDEALNCLLLRKKKNLTEEEKKLVDLDSKVVFEQHLAEAEETYAIKWRIDYKDKEGVLKSSEEGYSNLDEFDVEDCSEVIGWSEDYKEIRRPVFLKKSILARYFASDFNPELLEESDLVLMAEYLEENGYENTNGLEVMANLKELIKQDGFLSLDEADRIFYNYANWISLRRKGFGMLEAFERDLYPLIEEVVSIQKEVDLNNGTDSMTGFIDFMAVLKGEDFVRIIDNKTASSKYAGDSARTSPQLTIYAESENLENASYFIMLKKPKEIRHKTCKKCGVTTTRSVKDCPEGGTGKKRCRGDFELLTTYELQTQVVSDRITEEQKDLTFDEISCIMDKIKSEEFPKIERKGCFFFGKPCPFKKRCWEDEDDMGGLVKLGEL